MDGSGEDCVQIGKITASNEAIYLEESKMAYAIAKSCISCGACAGDCPTGAIKAGKDLYVIDAVKCVDCGACAGVCPVGAPAPAPKAAPAAPEKK